MNRTRVRSLAALTAIAALASIAVPSSLAAGYGHGRFVGTAKPQFGAGKGSPITVKVKRSRVRVVEMTFSLPCMKDLAFKANKR